MYVHFAIRRDRTSAMQPSADPINPINIATIAPAFPEPVPTPPVKRDNCSTLRPTTVSPITKVAIALGRLGRIEALERANACRPITRLISPNIAIAMEVNRPAVIIKSRPGINQFCIFILF